MNTISLISTTHREKGLANSKNLYSILQNISPELIFIELPKDQYADYFTNFTLRTLESDAINIFREQNQVEIVLVASVAPDASMFKEIDFLFDNIHNKSQHLDGILGYVNQFTCQYGFPYLNSNKHFEHLAAQKEEEHKTVQGLNNLKLIELYEMWNNIHNQREVEMLKNIHLYSNEHSFNNAVFLVGSAHSHSIIKKAKDADFQPNIELFNFREEANAVKNA
jgi:hypothetical protein